MKYFYCIKRNGKNYREETSNEVYPVVGAVYVAEDDQFPECALPDDEWIEISKEQYEEALEYNDYPFVYDGVHCVGCCKECAKCIDTLTFRNKTYVACENETELVNRDPYIYRSCCIIK